MWQRRRGEGGQYVVVVALMATVLLGAAGLAAGLGIPYIHGQMVQSAAGAAKPAAMVQSADTHQAALAALRDTEAGNASPIMVSLQLDRLAAGPSGVLGDTGQPLGGLRSTWRPPPVQPTKPAKPLLASNPLELAHNTETQGPTVLVLDGYAPGQCQASDPGSLSAIGNVYLNAPNGTITVDSASSSAAEFTGDVAVATASDQPQAIVGGYSTFGNVAINPTPATHAQPVADPLAGLPALAVPAVSAPAYCTSLPGNNSATVYTYSPCHYRVDLSLQGSDTVTFNPGQYIFDHQLNYAGNQTVTFDSGTYIFSKGLTFSGDGSINFGNDGNPGTYVFEGDGQGALSVIGNGAVKFGPGTYIFEGGDFTISGNASLNGTGVLLYFMKDANGDDAALKESGTPSMVLTPQTSGTYAGIVIFQAHPSWTPGWGSNCTGGSSCHSLSSDDTFQLIGDNIVFNTAEGSTTGIVYLPRGILQLTGNADADITFIVDQLQLTGNAFVTAEGYNGPYWPQPSGGNGGGWHGWQGWPHSDSTHLETKSAK